MTNNKTEGVEDCKHEPIIDTGVGYYHCPGCNTGWTYAEWEAALSSFPSPPAGVEQRAKGGIWVKASERLPDVGNEVFIRTVDKTQRWIVKVRSDNDIKVWIDFNGYHYSKDKVEWLDESQSIAGSESQGQQAVIQILPDDEKNWFPMECQDCGWIGSSGNSAGGGQIADTGDHDDPLCPCCLSKKVDEVDNKQPLSSYVDRLTKAGEVIKKLTEQYDELYWKTIPPPHTA